jgi:hypothetical protein
LLIATCLAATFLLPAGARAQSSSDPEATSPSGTIYEIPLDQARQQAAPRRSPSGGGGSGSGAQGSQDSSTYRSENNFGSSNEVPGASGDSRSGSSNPKSRSKSRSREQLADASPPPKAAADPASSGGPSGGDVVLLLVLLLAVALATVVLAIKARRSP